MGKKTFDDIKAGLDDAVAYAKGNKHRGKAHHVSTADVDVQTIRKNLGLTQAAFASAFGVSLATVRNWEQGRRRPEGPARVLLNVIRKNPKAVLGTVSL